MNDLISRKAAIEAIDNFSMEIIEKAYDACRGIYVDVSVGRRYTMTKEEVKDLLNALPSAQSGKWIEKEIYETRRKEEMQVARCSNCKEYLTTPHIYSFNHYSFCPHCGAKMEG